MVHYINLGKIPEGDVIRVQAWSEIHVLCCCFLTILVFLRAAEQKSALENTSLMSSQLLHSHSQPATWCAPPVLRVWWGEVWTSRVSDLFSTSGLSLLSLCPGSLRSGLHSGIRI